MKAAIFSAMVLGTIGSLAYADYIPGRTRPSAEADLEVIDTSGVYRDARDVKVVEFTTDDKGISKYILTVDGNAKEFEVRKVRETDCGDVYDAREVGIGTEEENTTLALRDMSAAICERPVKHIWEVEVITQGEGGQESRLFVGGDPEHYQLTMGDDKDRR